MSVSAFVAGATLGRLTDNGDVTVTYCLNGQFQHLIDGEPATAAFSDTIHHVCLELNP